MEEVSRESKRPRTMTFSAPVQKEAQYARFNRRIDAYLEALENEKQALLTIREKGKELQEAETLFAEAKSRGFIREEHEGMGRVQLQNELAEFVTNQSDIGDEMGRQRREVGKAMEDLFSDEEDKDEE
jgi:SPX domain protein involved in polyphosphate accumulation